MTLCTLTLTLSQHLCDLHVLLRMLTLLICCPTGGSEEECQIVGGEIRMQEAPVGTWSLSCDALVVFEG